MNHVTIHLKSGKPILVDSTQTTENVTSWIEGSRHAQWLSITTVENQVTRVPFDNIAYITEGPCYTG